MKLRLLLFIFLLSVNFPLNSLTSQIPEYDFLWEIYQEYKVSPVNPALLKHAEMMNIIEDIRSDYPASVRIRQVGESVEGRSLNLITVGTGQKKIFLWSQMHGNEPTATSALLDMLNYMKHNMSEQIVRDILTQTTLLILPMLNPDGAERFVRRNAQDIDVNRDARFLQSPEGRTLKAVRDEYEPDFGFNLHDMGTRNMVGKTRKLAAIALLTPPYDYEDNDNATKIRAKKVAAFFRKAIAREAYGMISKYDADYMPRAFGDAMQSWGVSTVLVESGGWHTTDRSELVRINFVGLLSTLHAIATDKYLESNPLLYDGLRRSGDYGLYDLMINDVTVINGRDMDPFIADIAINHSVVQREEGPVVSQGRIADLGDMKITTGKRQIDGSELVLVPGFTLFDPGLQPGRPLSMATAKDLIKKGITTVIGLTDLSSRTEMDALSSYPGSLSIHTGFIGSARTFTDFVSNDSKDALIFGLTRPILGVYLEGLTEQAEEYIGWFSIPFLADNVLFREQNIREFTVNDLPGIKPEIRAQLGLGSSGLVRRGAPADLLLFEKDEEYDTGGILRTSGLRYVIIKGEVVYENGNFVRDPSGIFLHR